MPDEIQKRAQFRQGKNKALSAWNWLLIFLIRIKTSSKLTGFKYLLVVISTWVTQSSFATDGEKVTENFKLSKFWPNLFV